MQYRLLGPVAAFTAGAEAPLGGNRQRALLARLLLGAGQPVATDVLAEDLWLGDPPQGAAITIRTYVSRLRTVLGPDSVRSTAGGYRMNVDDEDVDARRFERLLEAGSKALAEQSFGRAARQLHEALALWGGRALADVCAGGSLAAEARRLEELRLVCIEQRIEADLALGRQAALVAELRGLVQDAPLRERLWCQLVRALYGSGRQAEALAAVREARALLDRELGVEPSPELRRVELAVLRQEQEIALPVHAELPVPTSGLIGRDADIAEVTRLLGGHRLVTITGLGGIGKTRLALELAHRQRSAWSHGAWWVDLTSVSDPELVAATVARVLGLPDQTGGRSTVAALCDRLRSHELLLVIDNCEHVVVACAELVDMLLRSCPNLRVLATSRVPIGVAGEYDYALNPLPAPHEAVTGADLANAPAVRLFVERARAARRDMSTDEASLAVMAHICRELDGLPLAIELAAARAKSLSPADIAARLDDRFRLLQSRQRVADPRHRTLTAALDWSYDLRTPIERRLLCRLSVFSGGATLDAISAVCANGDAVAALDPLTRLVDASLVCAEPGADATRYTMLETVRQYAARRLADGPDPEPVRRAHAVYFTELAESANLSIDALGHGPQRHEYVLAEQHNMRNALDWSTEADPVLAARLVLAMENFWVTQAVAEGERRFARVLAVDSELPIAVQARLRRDHAGCLDVMEDFAGARAEYEVSRKLYLLMGDEVGAAYVDYRIGIVLLRGDDDLEGTRRLWQGSLDTFRQQKFPVGELQALGDLGGLEVDHGDRARGRAMIAASLEMARSVGWSWWAARADARLAGVAAADGQAEEAEVRARQLLIFARRTGNRQESLRALAILARAAAARGDDDRALTLWSTVIATRDDPGRFGRFDRAEYAAAMPQRPLPPPLPLHEAVELALSS
jgi:predicted ATPase/DNA-binding SARP family transcriptional activator